MCTRQSATRHCFMSGFRVRGLMAGHLNHFWKVFLILYYLNWCLMHSGCIFWEWMCSKDVARRSGGVSRASVIKWNSWISNETVRSVFEAGRPFAELSVFHLISSHHREPSEESQTPLYPNTTPPFKGGVPCLPPKYHLTQHTHCQPNPTPAAPLTQVHPIPTPERGRSEAITMRSITPSCLSACSPQETPFRPGD